MMHILYLVRSREQGDVELGIKTGEKKDKVGVEASADGIVEKKAGEKKFIPSNYRMY